MKKTIIEWLKKPFYTDVEVKSGSMNPKVTSQTSLPNQIETSHLNYDPFASYTDRQSTAQNVNMAMVQAQQVNAHILKWRELSHYPEVDEALSEIMNDSIVYDELESPLEISLDDIEMPDTIKKKITSSFEKIMYMLNFGDQGDDIFKQWYVDGQLNVECVFNNNNMKSGIQKLILLTPFNFFKILNPKDKKTYYFYNHNPSWISEKDFSQAKNVFKEEQVARITSGVWSVDKKVPLSFIQKAVKAINQLYLIEDAVVIYRITRAPEKRVFYIDTGRLPKTKAEEYVQGLIRKYRQKKIYDVQTGDVKNKTRSISILEDFWFPTNADGKGTKVETLQGVSANFAELDDLEYFVNKVYKALGVPMLRRKGDDHNFNISSGFEIEKSELKFFKFILKLRKRFNQLFLEILKRDIIAQKILTTAEWHTIKEKIRFKYASSNEFSTLKKLQIIENKLGIAASAISLKEDKVVSKDWVQREILLFDDDVIKKIDEDIKKEAKEDEEAGDNPEDEMEEEPFGGKPTPVKIVTAADEEKERKEKAKDETKEEGLIEKTKPLEEDFNIKDGLISNMLDTLKSGKVVRVGDTLYKLDGPNIIEVKE